MQSYSNHTKWDPWYHFFLSPIVLLNVLYAGMQLVRHPSADGLWLFLMSVALVIAVFKLRLNALKVQDRLIRLEEKLRLDKLAAGAPLVWADSLTTAQWIALRFASDGEMFALAEKAAQEKLEPNSIKEAIRQWRPDHHRV